ncbi:MAG TPA: CHAD domain-containing protein [Solirubrobacteraceae bacterium]|nr:CHAD domain-containing protein [Solirubrobacteraceae bacterium]
MTATLAASAAIGLGLTLARAGRERRAEQRRNRSRRLGVFAGEPLSDGLKRMATEQLELAIEQLSAGNGAGPAEEAIHETRKALKRLRTMMRMLETSLGEPALAQETATLRDAAAQLSAARDSEVMLETLESLVERHPRKLDRRGVRRLRARLVDERERARAETLGDPVRMALVVADLSACRLRVQTWQDPQRRERELLEPGLHRLYGAGRRRFKRARASKGERSLAMHEWRKRVKDLRYVGEMLQRRPSPSPFTLALPGGSPKRGERRDRESAPLRKLARRADRLGELLGEDHDLAVLAARVRRSHGRKGAEPSLGPGTRKALLKAIAKRRHRLQRQALKQGERLYAPPTKRFVRTTGKVYARAHRRALRRAAKALS